MVQLVACRKVCWKTLQAMKWSFKWLLLTDQLSIYRAALFVTLLEEVSAGERLDLGASPRKQLLQQRLIFCR